MKHLLSLMLFLAAGACHAQLVPNPASNDASSPIRRLTTPSGQVVTITPQNTTPGARPNNSLGGVTNMPPTVAFFINYAALMTPFKGLDYISITTSTDPGSAGAQKFDYTGDFRTDCVPSHMGRFDPLVFPGRNTAGHLHTFFGNSDLAGTLNDQTLGNLNTFGRSSCAGGIANRSGYWVPSLINTVTAAPVAPIGIRVYYKNDDSQWRATHPPVVVAPPQGLRMIAGSPAATSDQSGVIYWNCEDDMPAETISHIATAAELAANPTWCAAPNDTLTMQVIFPQCWDGVNLDSPGHQAHVAYENFYTGCPTGFPVVLPQVGYKVDYSVASLGGRANLPNLRLSCDSYPLNQPGGICGHGDWINGWKREVMEAFVTNCLHGSTDCHNDVIDRWDTNPHRIMCSVTGC